MNTTGAILLGIGILFLLLGAMYCYVRFAPSVHADSLDVEAEAWQHIREAEELFALKYGNMRVHVFVELER